MYFFNVKINDFPGDPNDIWAKTATLTGTQHHDTRTFAHCTVQRLELIEHPRLSQIIIIVLY